MPPYTWYPTAQSQGRQEKNPTQLGLKFFELLIFKKKNYQLTVTVSSSITSFKPDHIRRGLGNFSSEMPFAAFGNLP